MNELRGFQPANVVASVRFVQGYRYLDRCGEILIRLENELGEGWIPAEPSPQGGILRNYELGMELVFSSESMTIKQEELIVAEQLFGIAGCAYEIICGATEIERVLSPAIRTVFKKRCSSLAEADQTIVRLNLVSPSTHLTAALGGKPTVLHFTTTRESDEQWDGLPVHRRNRIHVEGSGQLQQPPFDERLVRRIRSLSANQNDALKQLIGARSKFVASQAFAATLDIEHSFEDEFPYRSFQFRTFLDDGWSAIENLASELVKGDK